MDAGAARLDAIAPTASTTLAIIGLNCGDDCGSAVGCGVAWGGVSGCVCGGARGIVAADTVVAGGGANWRLRCAMSLLAWQMVFWQSAMVLSEEAAASAKLAAVEGVSFMGERVLCRGCRTRRLFLDRAMGMVQV